MRRLLHEQSYLGLHCSTNMLLTTKADGVCCGLNLSHLKSYFRLGDNDQLPMSNINQFVQIWFLFQEFGCI